MREMVGKGRNLPEDTGFPMAREKADAFRRIFL